MLVFITGLLFWDGFRNLGNDFFVLFRVKLLLWSCIGFNFVFLYFVVVLLFKGNVLFVIGFDIFVRNFEVLNFLFNGIFRLGFVFFGIFVRVGLGGEMCIGFGEEIDDICNKFEFLKIKKK